MSKRGITVTVLLLVLLPLLRAQNGDSLIKVMEASANDTAKVKIMLKVIRTRTVKLGTDERIKLADSCIALADRLGYLKGKGNALLVKGELVLNSDNPNPYAGIESGYKALQIFEELKDVERQSQANQLLGWFYHVAKNNKEALVFTLKALEYGERTNNRKLMGGCYNNLGAIYHSMKDMKKSLRCYKMAASLSEELKNYPRLARTYGNISELLTELGKYDESMTYRNKAITLFREMDSRGGVIWHYAGLAEILIYKGLYDKALHYLDTVERFSVKDGWIELILNCYSVKEELFRRKGEFRNAYHYKTVYHRLDDSIAKANDVNKVSELKLFYEREKTEKIREMKDRMEAEKHRAELREQKIILFTVLAFLSLISVSLILIYRTLRTVKKQKSEIEDKRREIEEKQKEILDSIRYAKRIQQAHMPSETGFRNILRRIRTRS